MKDSYVKTMNSDYIDLQAHAGMSDHRVQPCQWVRTLQRAAPHSVLRYRSHTSFRSRTKSSLKVKKAYRKNGRKFKER
uniref:Uncharacterized protein n=1 Tax=blood disease bacterium R229 TaxID=741978 RepID=G2ZK31_9RALS|nr:hypothetical protein BDB_60001 [blood disease bacterium R229]